MRKSFYKVLVVFLMVVGMLNLMAGNYVEANSRYPAPKCPHNTAGSFRTNGNIHEEICRQCGEVIGSHQASWGVTGVESLGEEEHKQKCNGYGGNCTITRIIEHNFNEQGSCKVCGYHTHYFDRIGGTCKHGSCNEVLKITEVSGLDHLPLQSEYMMYPNTEWERNLNSFTITTNFIPYSDPVTKEYLELSVNIQQFRHGNFAAHDNVVNNAEYAGQKVDVSLPENADSIPFGNWGAAKSYAWLEVGDKEPIVSVANNIYTVDCSNLPDGHYRIESVKLGNMIVSSYDAIIRDKLFVKGECSPTISVEDDPKILIGYRDTEGNNVEGMPNDTTIGKIDIGEDNIYIATADLETIESIGYKYIGYENGNGLKIPDAQYSITNSSSVEVNVRNNKYQYVVFVIEKDPSQLDEPIIKVAYRDIEGKEIPGAPIDEIIDQKTIGSDNKHTVKVEEVGNLDKKGWRYKGYQTGVGSTIPNIPYTTESKESVTVDVSKEKQKYVVFVFEPIMIQVSHLYVNGGYVQNVNNNPATYNLTELIANNQTQIDSLNKIYFPKITLLSYTLKGKNVIESKEFDIDNKNVKETVDVNKRDKKEKVGYRSNMTLDFIYSSVLINIEHKDYQTSGVITSLNGKELKYSKEFNMDMVINSLVTEGQNTLPELGNEPYNISGKIIKMIEIELGNETILMNFDSEENEQQRLEWYQLKFDQNNFTQKQLNSIKSDAEKNIKNGTSSKVIFWYEQGDPILTVQHYSDKGEKLKPDQYIEMKEEKVVASSYDLESEGYKYIEYTLDGTLGNEAVKNNGTSDVRSVEVVNNGSNRVLVFIYTKTVPEDDEKDEDVVVNNKIDLSATVKLRSNDRGNEEYNVDTAIPVFEDLYANVITDRFVLDRTIVTTEIDKTAHVTVIQPYINYSGDMVYDTAYFDMDLTFYYSYVDDAKLYIVDKAIVKNSLLDNNIVLNANYGNDKPVLYYSKGGYLLDSGRAWISYEDSDEVWIDYTLDLSETEEYLNPYEVEYLYGYDVENSISMLSDTLKVTDQGKTYTVLDGYNLDDLDPAPFLTSNNFLFDDTDNIIINVKNGDYATSADIDYKLISELGNSSVVSANSSTNMRFENIPGNPVKVHTPVVNVTKVENTPEVKQWVTKNNYSNADATLILGKSFTIRIPNKGSHINASGYGNNKNYNFDGLNANGYEFSNTNAFAKDREVKFSFGVVDARNNTYIPANTTIKLGAPTSTSDETFKFTIPEWEKELWKSGKHTIETRVIACNATETDLEKTEVGANKNRNNYVATSTLKVNVIGEIMDLEVRATNDPGWSLLNSSLSTNNTISTNNLPLGQKGQNSTSAYKYGLKLGYSAYFDITTTGWTGDTTENIKIKPKYYFINKNSNNSIAQEVKLYYKTGPTGAYISLENNPIRLTTTMNKDCLKGTNYISSFAPNGKFVIDAARELSSTIKWLSVNGAAEGRALVNHSIPVDIGNTSEIDLKYATRLSYQRVIEILANRHKLSGLPTGVLGTDYCIGHWYGAIRLPSTTIAVKPNEIPKLDGSNKLTNGYIIVAFEEIISESNGGTDYLEYIPTTTQFPITLPDGGNGKLPNNEDIPVVIYELIADKIDYEVGGTH